MNITEPKYPEWMGELPRACAPWTATELAVLAEAFKRGDSLKQIAFRHGRAEGSIESRLARVCKDNFASRDERRSRPCNPFNSAHCSIERVYETNHYFIGQRVMINKSVIGTVCKPEGSLGNTDTSIWVHNPERGYASRYSVTSIAPLPNGQL